MKTQRNLIVEYKRSSIRKKRENYKNSVLRIFIKSLRKKISINLIRSSSVSNQSSWNNSNMVPQVRKICWIVRNLQKDWSKNLQLVRITTKEQAHTLLIPNKRKLRLWGSLLNRKLKSSIRCRFAVSLTKVWICISRARRPWARSIQSQKMMRPSRRQAPKFKRLKTAIFHRIAMVPK